MRDQELNQLYKQSCKKGEPVGGFIFNWGLSVPSTSSLQGPQDCHDWGVPGAGVRQQVGKRKERGGEPGERFAVAWLWDSSPNSEAAL